MIIALVSVTIVVAVVWQKSKTEQIAGAPDNPPDTDRGSSPTDTSRKNGTLYFETSNNVSTMAIYTSGRVFIKYNNTSRYQEVKPSAPLYGLYAYSIMFRKSMVHGRDSQYNSVVGKIDALVQRVSGVADEATFRDSNVFKRMRKEILREITEVAKNDYGLPVNKSKYSGWAKTFENSWVKLSLNTRKDMAEFSSAYQHRLTSEYIHKKIAEVTDLWDETRNHYISSIKHSYIFSYSAFSLQGKLTKMFRKEALEFNKKLYGYGTERTATTAPPSVDINKNRTQPDKKPLKQPKSDGKEPEAIRPPTVEKGEDTTPKPTDTPQPSVKHKQGELTVKAMIDRLDELKSIKFKVPADKQKEAYRAYGKSWCLVNLKVSAVNKEKFLPNDDEYLILKRGVKDGVRCIRITMSRKWYAPGTDKHFLVSGIWTPSTLYALSSTAKPTIAKLNALTAEKVEKKMYFIHTSGVARLKDGDFVSCWFTLDCSAGDMSTSFSFSEPEQGDTGKKATKIEKNKASKKVPNDLEKFELSIADMQRHWQKRQNIVDDDRLSLKQKDTKVRALGKRWCYFAYKVESTRETTIWLDRDTANAAGLQRTSKLEVIEISISTDWYDPRTGRNTNVQGEHISFYAIKGVSKDRVIALNKLGWEANRGYKRYWIEFSEAENMVKGDGIVLKYTIDCTSGDGEVWYNLTSYRVKKLQGD